MPDLVYHSPDSITNLMALMDTHGTSARVVAGCTDFIPSIRTGRWCFDQELNLIDVSKMDELHQIEKQGDILKIGAGVNLTRILESPEVQTHCPVLAQAVEQMASLQVRNTATMGGNICMASPAADTVPPLLVSDAWVMIQDADGEHKVLLTDFFTGPGRSVLTSNQVLTHICIPVKKSNEAAWFQKIGTRTAVIISVVSAAVRVSATSGICDTARIALGSVAPTPVRVTTAEAFLEGKPLDEPVIEECARLAAHAISPISDLRSSKEYRKDVAQTLVKRSITACTEALK
ncbi:MAG: xanthine dehydrogenase family protein subunit M [Desulfotignum sp.]|nr:xanthine dehydrogenase family protein subunit M [Desulfotignum sp.]